MIALLVYLQKISSQPNPHMSARNELEAGEEFHTLPGGVGDHTLYNAGMRTHTHAYAHNYPKIPASPLSHKIIKKTSVHAHVETCHAQKSTLPRLAFVQPCSHNSHNYLGRRGILIHT